MNSETGVWGPTVCTIHAGWKGGSCLEANISARSAKEFEEFARDCVRLAEQADTPELREKLLNLAREWMRAVMPDEDLAVRTGK